MTAAEASPLADDGHQPAFFHPEEWPLLKAATDRLIPADELEPGALAAAVPEFIDRQLESPCGHGLLWYMQGPFDPGAPELFGHQSSMTPHNIYGVGLKALDASCRNTHGKVFAERPVETRDQILLDPGVGGCGFHWSGLIWWPLSADLQIHSHTIERYGRNKIPESITIQDFPVTSEEIEPFLDQFEKVCGVSGQAGNLKGQRVEGGHPFEASRENDHPLPPLKSVYGDMIFQKAAQETGLHPFHIPAANASAPYTPPYGVRLGPCNFCGYCKDFGCYMYSKASPQTTILPVLRDQPRFELRTQFQIIKVNLDSTGKQAIGVTYIDAHGRQIEQPAELVILSAFQMHSVRLPLLSGIGDAYAPARGMGQGGRNCACQTTAGSVKLVALVVCPHAFDPGCRSPRNHGSRAWPVSGGRSGPLRRLPHIARPGRTGAGVA